MSTSPVTNDHLTAFGMYVHVHASLENALQMVIAGVLRTDPGSAIITTASMTAKARRDLALSLIHLREERGFEIGSLRTLVEQTDNFTKLRTYICHGTWVAGRKPNTIKPQWIMAKGQIKLLGAEHNEKEYTAIEIEERALKMDALKLKIAEELNRLHLLDAFENLPD